MWEAIESNRRRSVLLLALMAAMLVGLGALIGAFVDPGFWWAGAILAFVIFWILYGTAVLSGDRLLLASAGARRIESKDQFPRLWNVVEEMKIASGLSHMPQVWVIEDSRPNAFATGRSPERAAVAVTSGLVSRLNRDELQGVVAHEVAHVVNRDIRFMTLAGILVGSVVLLSEMFLRYLWWGGIGHSRRRTSGRGGDARIQAAILAAGILAAILAPLFSRLLYFACSRRREFLADASGALYTRYPPGLASALEKIASRQRGRGRRERGEKASRILAPMYIINPLRAYGSSGWFSTHPPTEQRIEILRAMGGAHYAAYEEAYRSVRGKGRTCLGEVTLTDGRKPLQIREPTPEAEREDPVERVRDVTGLLDRLADFTALTCACGVGIRIPPGFDRSRVPCPRCGREHAVPVAERDANQPEEALRYERKSAGWESFRCPACGKANHLSPAFVAPRVRCAGCRRKIEIVSGAAAR